MSTRALLLTAILLAGALAAAPAVVATRLPRYDWSADRGVTDPHIRELGSWAVVEHVRQANDGLRFGIVMSVLEETVAGGTNYKLYLDAADAGGNVAAYRAVVYEQQGTNARKLVSFVRTGPVPGVTTTG